MTHNIRLESGLGPGTWGHFELGHEGYKEEIEFFKSWMRFSDDHHEDAPHFMKLLNESVL